MNKLLIATVLAAAMPTAAHAAPGMATEVYGANVEAGKIEVESRYDRLSGGPDSGEDVFKLEAAWGVNDRLRLGLLGEFEREPGDPRKLEEVGIEAIYRLGSVGPVDVAVYGEYAIGINGPDAVETKLLLQHRSGPVDIRFNLIGEKKLKSGEKLELEYAFSADTAVAGEFRLGVQGFGELGTFDKLLPRAEHFVGPVAKVEIEGLGPEAEIEIGYLFALGKARDDTDGRLRVALEFEF